MRRLRYAPLQGLATGAIVAAGFGFCVAANWPGHLSYDSVVQLFEGRTAKYGGWHPPVMSFFLGLGDAVLPGTGPFLLLDSLALYLATASLLLLRRHISWVAPVAAFGLVLTPQFLVYPGIIWKDVLFAVFAVAGFVALAFAAALWSKPARRAALLLPALTFLVLASLARQNGATTLPVAAFVVGFTAWRAGGQERLLRSFAYGLAWLVGSFTVMACASVALETRATGASSAAGQFRLLETYDLAGALASEPSLDLRTLATVDPLLESQMRRNAARLYSPERNDTLAQSADLQMALVRANERTIPTQWREIVFAHPLLYLKLRWTAFRWVFLTPNLAACRPVYVGVSGPPDLMKDLGLQRRTDARDIGLAEYFANFAGTPLLSHPAFAALGLLEMVLLLRRRRPEDIAIAAMIFSGLAFTATFFVISIACDYRYLYFLDVAALVGLFYLSLDAGEWIASGLSSVSALVGLLRRWNQLRR